MAQSPSRIHKFPISPLGSSRRLRVPEPAADACPFQPAGAERNSLERGYATSAARYQTRVHACPSFQGSPPNSLGPNHLQSSLQEALLEASLQACMDMYAQGAQTSHKLTNDQSIHPQILANPWKLAFVNLCELCNRGFVDGVVRNFDTSRH